MSATAARDPFAPPAAHQPACAACGLQTLRARFQKGGRHFWECRVCRSMQQYPLPTAQELVAYYDQSYRDGLYKEFAAAVEMKRMTAGYRLRRIVDTAEPGRWLDVGAADGCFVEAARAKGIDAVGLELSEVAVAAARLRNVPVRQGDVEDHRPDRPYNTVTAFDVLEHVLDPGRFLENAHRLLRADGTLVLTLPNLASPYARAMGKRWWFAIPEEHLHYFHPRSLRTLLARHDFDPLFVRPIGKPLTLEYGLGQFREYNPVVYRALSVVTRPLPKALARRPMPFRIGEMLAIARRTG